MSTFGSKAPKSREPTYGDLRAIEDLNARATDLINVIYADLPEGSQGGGGADQAGNPDSDPWAPERIVIRKGANNV
jgi:hypothetical protein